MRLVPETELLLGDVAKIVLGMDGGRTPAKDVDKKQLAIGMTVELEHTDDPKAAERIARQHLAEDPEYYTKPMKKDWGADEAKGRVEELAKAAQVTMNISKGWIYKCKKCGQTHLGVLVQPQRCDVEGCESSDFEKLPYESKKTASSSEKTWQQIQNEQDPDGTQHDLRLTCTRCSNTQTCRCTKPKREFKGICHECSRKDKEGVVRGFEGELKDRLGQTAQVNHGPVAAAVGMLESLSDAELVELADVLEVVRSEGQPMDDLRMDLRVAIEDVARDQGSDAVVGIADEIERIRKRAAIPNAPEDARTTTASVFVLEDDPDRIVIFRKAFGSSNVFVTKSVSEGLSMLREGGFSRIYLDRDLSHPNETGEDLAWEMEKEKLCPTTPVVIHSENTRGQKVMARYIGRYHSNVTVIPFKQLKHQLIKPGTNI